MPPRSPPTHFLCIPLITATSRPQIAASLSSFKADVTSPDSFGVPEQAIRPVGTLHLTLGVMSFPKNEGLEKATALLKTIMPRKILAGVVASASQQSGPDASGQAAAAAAAVAEGPLPPLLLVTLKGLRSMQPGASKASVLYAPPVDADGVLGRFCETLRSTFQEAGLMAEEDRPLLLHATILNTIYVKGGRNNNDNNNSPGGRGRGKGKRYERLTIDARQILERYEDYMWMENVPVETIAICKMGAKKLDDGDEAYEVEAEIDVV
jgi:activating signal cointegrator complex subunit 1